MDFTGERFVPGQGTMSMQKDHISRYEFASQFAAGKNVLDIACGSGYGSALLAQKARLVDGVDISQESISYAQSEFSMQTVNYQTGDIVNFTSNRLYDLIICFETIEHIEDYETALRNLKKLLTPDGMLIISSPNRFITSPKCKHLTDRPGEYHVREFTIEELKGAMVKLGYMIGNDSIFGQRLQRYFSSRFIGWAYTTVFKPKKRSNYKVAPIPPNKMPRYFIIVAQNGDALL